MNLISVPILVRPMMTRMIPAMTVASMSPPNPCCCTTRSAMGTNTAAGPPICTLLPPSREIRNPAMIAVNIPSAGAGNGVCVPAGTLAMPSASANGKAIRPTVTPALRSAPKSPGPYPFEKTARILGAKTGLFCFPVIASRSGRAGGGDRRGS